MPMNLILFYNIFKFCQEVFRVLRILIFTKSLNLFVILIMIPSWRFESVEQGQSKPASLAPSLSGDNLAENTANDETHDSGCRR